MGDTKGPFRFDTKELAAKAAQLMSERMVKPGRFGARLLPEGGHWHDRPGTVKPTISSDEALKRLMERGEW